MALTKDERAAINRENARKSTGPRSAEGKAASARNALTHGLSARVFALVPGEDPAEHAAFVAEWVDDYRPATAGRRALVERAADAAWKLRRLARADESQAARAVRDALPAHDVAQITRAEALGDRLRADTPERPATAPGAPAGGRRRGGRQVERAHPRAINAELETFLEGVRWKLDRWQDLDDLLTQDGYWEWDAKFLAVRLLGARPEDALLDMTARGVFLCCRAVHPSVGRLVDDVDLATEGWPDRAIEAPRADELAEDELPYEPAKAELRRMVGHEQERLRALLPALEAREAVDRSQAPLRALADAAGLAAPLRRYEANLDRTLRTCVHALESPPRVDLDLELDPPADLDAEPAPATAPEPAAPPCSAAPAAPAPAPSSQPAPAAARPAKPAAAPTPTSTLTAPQPRQNEANPAAAAPRPATPNAPAAAPPVPPAEAA